MKRGLLLVLALLMWVSAAWAQDTTSVIEYGTPVEGELNNNRSDQTWTLTVEGADRIHVEAERLSGTLLPELAVRALDGSILTTATQDPTGARSSIDYLDLPAAGIYQIIIQRADGATGATEGRYRLSVTPLATAADHPNNLAVVGALDYDTPVTGTIDASHWYHRYTLTAQAADVIRVEAVRTSGALQPQVEILDASGTSLNYGYGERGQDRAQIESYQLPDAGDYTIVVQRNSGYNGGTSGGYELRVSLLGAGETSPRFAERTVQPVTYGEPVQGEISALWYEEWALNVQSSDVISIVVERGDFPATLVPYVTLRDANGTVLAVGYEQGDGLTASILHYALPTVGEYTIRVERSSGNVGDTTGGYRLTVTLDGVGPEAPALRETTGTLNIGDTVEGELTNALWNNRWQFEGTAGQVVNIAVVRTSGTFYPLLDVLDPTGASVGGSYYDSTRSQTQMQGFTLQTTGTYTIRVFRDSETNGWTSGGYSLSLTAAP